jgi:DNA primase
MPRDLSKLVTKFEKRSYKKNNLDWLKFVDVVDMLEQLDIDNISRATSDEIVFSCPFPGHSHGDEKPSCYMNDGSKNPKLTSVWKCHACGRAGNAIIFVSEHNNISRQKATIELREYYAPGFRKPKYGSIQREFDERRKKLETPQEYTNYDNSLDPTLYEQFYVDWKFLSNRKVKLPYLDYMLDRGFDIQDLINWNIGYDKYSDRITIPIYNDSGNFVGVKARSFTEGRKPKYLNLGDKEGFSPRYGFSSYEKSLVVFGVNHWGEVPRYVFVEGEIDVMSLAKIGIPAICTGGASLSSTQANIIIDYCDEAILFLDNDLAGINAMLGINKEGGEHKQGIIEILEPFIKVRLVENHEYDPNDYLRAGQTDKLKKLIAEARSSFHLRLSSVV